MGNFFFVSLPLLVVADTSYVFFFFGTPEFQDFELPMCDTQSLREFLIPALIATAYFVNYFVDFVVFVLMVNTRFNDGCDNFFYVFLGAGFIPIFLYGCILSISPYIMLRSPVSKDNHLEFPRANYMENIVIYTMVLVCVTGCVLCLVGALLDLNECDDETEQRRYSLLLLISFLLMLVIFHSRDKVSVEADSVELTNWVIQWFGMVWMLIFATFLIFLEEGEFVEVIRCIRCFLVSSGTSIAKAQMIYILGEASTYQPTTTYRHLDNRYHYVLHKWVYYHLIE